MIIVANRRRKQEKLLQEYPGAIIVDITSKAQEPLVKLSPFYPHGGIPIPFSSPATGASVEGIWQGLKVFESVGIDREVIQKRSMKGLKRSVRRFGPPRGHQRGLNSSELLDYMTARREIYLPTYRWVLEHKVLWIIERLRAADRAGKTIILLDYNSSTDVDDPKKPLSHAYLVKAYAEGLYPYEDAIGLEEPISQRSVEQSLASTSFQLFSTTRPEKPVVVPLSTKVTDEDLAEAYIDEYGVMFSPDRKRLLSAPRNLVSYTIPDTVTTICDWAFSSCSRLTSLTMPDSVTTIGECALLECYHLAKFTIPESVTSIGDNAFGKCKSLTSLTISNSVTTIVGNPFVGLNLQLDNQSPHFLLVDNVLFTADKKRLIAYCSTQTSYCIPDTVTSIGNGAFKRCVKLTSLTMPNSLKAIGDKAFSWCRGLTSLTIPNAVTHIGSEAFSWCRSLTSLTLPESVTTIGDRAFFMCRVLPSLTIPDSVTAIGDFAFGRCESLTSLTIPNSVTSIRDGAFYNCSSLTSLTIPDSVTSMGQGALYGCDNLNQSTREELEDRFGKRIFERY